MHRTVVVLVVASVLIAAVVVALIALDAQRKLPKAWLWWRAPRGTTSTDAALSVGVINTGNIEQRLASIKAYIPYVTRIIVVDRDSTVINDSDGTEVVVVECDTSDIACFLRAWERVAPGERMLWLGANVTPIRHVDAESLDGRMFHSTGMYGDIGLDAPPDHVPCIATDRRPAQGASVAMWLRDVLTHGDVTVVNNICKFASGHGGAAGALFEVKLK